MTSSPRRVSSRPGSRTSRRSRRSAWTRSREASSRARSRPAVRGPSSGRASDGGGPEREQIAAKRLVVAQRRGEAAEADRALLEDIDPVGEGERELHVLLGEQDGQTLALEPRDLLAEVVHDEGGEPLRRLVEQQQLGVAHQRAGDGEHLLLAAGEVAALTGRQLPQLREEVIDPFHRPARCGHAAAGHVEVLPHGEVGEDAPVLRDEADAGARHPVRRPAGDVAALPHDAAGVGRSESHDRPHGGRLADPVAAQQADALARRHLHRHAEEHPRKPVRGVDVLDLEPGRGRHRRSPR